MKKLWQQYAERIDAMTLRERMVIFLAAAAMLVVFVYSLWIDSEFSKSNRLSHELGQRRAEMTALQQEVAKLANARQSDPDRINREQLAALRAELAKVQSGIAAEERKFTAPDRMRAVLEQLLVKNQRVKLIALRTVPVVSIAEERASAGAAAAKPGAKPQAAGRLIFRHGVELTVAGAYLDILVYLADLERLPTQLYWSALEMQGEYPTVTIKLTLFTLSLDQAWLSV